MLLVLLPLFLLGFISSLPQLAWNKRQCCCCCCCRLLPCFWSFLIDGSLYFQATPTKEFSHSRTVVCFCTAVVVECLGAVQKLDTDIVQRVLGFVFDSLNPEITGNQDYKVRFNLQFYVAPF
jgi:hypothetical protein